MAKQVIFWCCGCFEKPVAGGLMEKRLLEGIWPSTVSWKPVLAELGPAVGSLGSGTQVSLGEEGLAPARWSPGAGTRD